VDPFDGYLEEVTPLGKILPPQSVTVFTGSALPGCLRVTEVNLDARCFFKVFASSHVFAVIDQQSATQVLGNLSQNLSNHGIEGVADLLGTGVAEM
jgi:hypothetical protein